MRLLLDENMSDRRLAARLRAQGHEPVLATGVGLLSATDARVFIAAITQALPVLTRDSEDFTDLHDLIMAAGGHHSGVSNSRPSECDSSWFAHFDSDKMMRHHRDVEKDLRYGLLEPEPARFWRSSACFGS